MGASDLLNHIAPGQHGTLHQGSGQWREVRCERVTKDAVQLSLVQEKGEGSLSLYAKTFFQTIVEGGMMRIEGSLDSPNPSNLNLGVRFTPFDQPMQVVNRRDSYRVAVSLRGKVRGTAHGKQDNYDDEWDCAVRDISVGGAKMTLKSPPPFMRSLAIVRLTFQNEDLPIMLPCKIIQALPGRNPPPMDALVRVAFHTNARQESVLTRYVNWAQMELLKKGLR